MIVIWMQFAQIQLEVIHAHVRLDIQEMVLIVLVLSFNFIFFPWFWYLWTSIYFQIDINECLTNNGGCHEYAKCTNTIGSRNCECDSGFTGNGYICHGIFLFFF